MLIQIEDYEVIVYFVEAREMGRFARRGWRWTTPWSPPVGPFDTAVAALRDFADHFERGEVPPIRPMRLDPCGGFPRAPRLLALAREDFTCFARSP